MARAIRTATGILLGRESLKGLEDSYEVW